MNLYQTQHSFYCGIDLHAKEMYACVVDQSGRKQLHRNFKTRQSDKFFDEIAPFGTDIVVGCEPQETGRLQAASDGNLSQKPRHLDANSAGGIPEVRARLAWVFWNGSK